MYFHFIFFVFLQSKNYNGYKHVLYLLFLGEKREDGGQNHCTSTIGFTFWKGEQGSDTI